MAASCVPNLSFKQNTFPLLCSALIDPSSPSFLGFLTPASLLSLLASCLETEGLLPAISWLSVVSVSWAMPKGWVFKLKLDANLYPLQCLCLTVLPSCVTKLCYQAMLPSYVTKLVNGPRIDCRWAVENRVMMSCHPADKGELLSTWFYFCNLNRLRNKSKNKHTLS